MIWQKISKRMNALMWTGVVCMLPLVATLLGIIVYNVVYLLASTSTNTVFYFFLLGAFIGFILFVVGAFQKAEDTNGQ